MLGLMLSRCYAGIDAFKVLCWSWSHTLNLYWHFGANVSKFVIATLNLF